MSTLAILFIVGSNKNIVTVMKKETKQIWYAICCCLAIFALLWLIMNIVLWPAGSTLSKIQVKQRQSDRNLKTISKWIIDYKDSHGGDLPDRLCDLLPSNKSNLLVAFKAPSRSLSSEPVVEWTDKNTNCYTCFDYVVCVNTNNEITVGFQNNLKATVIAYEKPGLWPDDTVSVFFQGLGALRMNTYDFNKIMSKEKLTLYHNNVSGLWQVSK